MGMLLRRHYKPATTEKVINADNTNKKPVVAETTVKRVKKNDKR